jgi:hypothetical protein
MVFRVGIFFQDIAVSVPFEHMACDIDKLIFLFVDIFIGSFLFFSTWIRGDLYLRFFDLYCLLSVGIVISPKPKTVYLLAQSPQLLMQS